MFIAATVQPEVPLPALRERHYHYCLTIRNVSEARARKQFTYLNRFFGFLGPPRTSAELFDRLDPEAITVFLIDYAKRYGPESRREMHCTARSFLRFAYEERFIRHDLSALVPAVRKFSMGHIVRGLPPCCIVSLDKSIARDCPTGLRDAAIVCLLNTYGVRGVQVRRLLLEHVDWERERIHFPACKGGRAIEQHLTAETGNRLADYIVNGRPESSLLEVFLMQSTAAAMTKPQQLSHIIHRRLKQANISVPRGVSHGTHGFRHAFATRMVGQVPFKDLVDMLGHRDPSSTLIYAKVDTNTLQQAALPWPGAVS